MYFTRAVYFSAFLFNGVQHYQTALDNLSYDFKLNEVEIGTSLNESSGDSNAERNCSQTASVILNRKPRKIGFSLCCLDQHTKINTINCGQKIHIRSVSIDNMGILSQIKYAMTEWSDNWNDRIWYTDRYSDYVMGPLHRNVYPKYRGSIRVMQQDWDNLIVFDACRHDLFEDFINVSQFDEYETRVSLGSNTGEWTTRNFCDEDHRTHFGDTVYVIGNIAVSRRVTNQNFHQMYHV